MNCDIVNLREFYASPLGRLSRRCISASLTRLWDHHPGERLIGLGFATPYLDRFRADAERTIAFMPAAQGAHHWPPREPSATALVFEEDLPLADSSVDRILLVHALEHSENPGETLREMWRVLAPGGKLVLVVPNRRGMWARFEHTPFGTGRPYSRGQIVRLLNEALFTPEAWSDALFYPPTERRFLMQFAPLLERFGRKVGPGFCGVLLVEATKKLYSGIPVKARRSRRVFVPVLSPQGASREYGGLASMVVGQNGESTGETHFDFGGK
jgi:SAM-dependent methyltransferase